MTTSSSAARAQPSEPELDPIEEAYARAKLKAKRGRALAPPPHSMARAIAPFLKAKGEQGKVGLTSLQQRWPQIAGADLAKVCRPERLSTDKTGQVLHLRVHPAAAVIVQHQVELIRQRVSVLLGGQLRAVKLVQGSLAATPANPVKERRPVTSEQREALADTLSTLDNDKLKKALLDLGVNILTS